MMVGKMSGRGYAGALRLVCLGLAVGWLLVGMFSEVQAADKIELRDGRSYQGKLLLKTATVISFKIISPNGSLTVKYPIQTVVALTVKGKRRVLSSAADTPTNTTKPAGDSTADGAKGAAERAQRSRSEVKAIIAKMGKSKPDWYDNTRLSYPKSLDLSFPKKPSGKWNARKNVGQYVWSILNENPGRWQGGIKFMHFMLKVNKKDKNTSKRVMRKLGEMYHNYFGDHARAAYWWEKGEGSSIHLAHCYWELGNATMAKEMLKKYRRNNSRVIKLLSDMGDLKNALKFADSLAKKKPGEGYTAAGNALRQHGQFKEALAYYNKVATVKKGGRHVKKFRKRAQSSVVALQAIIGFDLSRVKDGTYADHAMGYVGPVNVAVIIQDGKIKSVTVGKHSEKQFYSSIREVPLAIVKRQGIKGVDGSTGATITSTAILNATAKALLKATK